MPSLRGPVVHTSPAAEVERHTAASMIAVLVCAIISSVRAEPGTFSSLARVDADWWVESSLARVMPSTTQPRSTAGRSTSAAVHMASNEHESFQVALRPAANQTYSVSWDPIAGPAGEVDSNLRLSWEQVSLSLSLSLPLCVRVCARARALASDTLSRWASFMSTR